VAGGSGPGGGGRRQSGRRCSPYVDELARTRQITLAALGGA